MSQALATRFEGDKKGQFDLIAAVRQKVGEKMIHKLFVPAEEVVVYH